MERLHLSFLVLGMLAVWASGVNASPPDGFPQGVDDNIIIDINTSETIDIIGNDLLNGSTSPLKLAAKSSAVSASTCPTCVTVTGATDTSLLVTTGTSQGTTILFYYSSDLLGESLNFSATTDCDGFDVPNSSDADSCAIVTFTVQYVADLPSLSVNSVIDVDENDSANLGIAAALTDLDGSETLKVIVSGLPSGTTLTDGVSSSSSASTDVTAWNLADIEIQITGENNSFYTVVVTATSTTPNGDTANNVENIALTINTINDNAPVAVADTYTVNEGGALSETAGLVGSGVLNNDSDADLPADILEVSLIGSPPSFASSFSLNQDGSFTYVHDGSENFSTSFRYRINDGVANSEIVTVTINITSLNDAPVALADAYATNEGGTISATAGTGGTGVLSNDSDSDLPADTLSVALGSGPNFASSFILNTDGSFSYTHDDSENFSDSFTYELSDGTITSSPATVSITISPINDNTTTVVGDAYGVAEGATVSGTGGLDGTGVLGNDSDIDLPANTLNVVLVSAPSFASSFILNADGSFSYTHDDSENFSDSFSYRVNDGVNDSNIVSANITITPVNDNPPVSVGDAYTLDEGASLSVAVNGVIGNDSDVDGDSLTVTLVSGPTYASAFAVNPDGSFDYTHNDSENFSDSFTYTISDGIFTSALATVSFTINHLDDNTPVVTGDFSGSVIEGNVGDVAVTDSGVIGISDADVDDNPSFPDVLESGVYVSFNLVAGSWTITLDQSSVQFLDEGDVVTDTFTMTATDSTTQDIVISITGTNDIPVIADQTVSVAENSVQDVLVVDLGLVDPDADDTFSYTIDSGLGSPEEFKIVNGQLLVADHTPDQELLDFETTPDYSLAITVTDSQGATDTALIVVNVTDEQDAPGSTVCEEFDDDGVSLNTLPVFLSPLLDFYTFTAATPCHRVIGITDDYYMEQSKELIAVSPIPTPADTALKNYRVSLNDIPKNWDQDSTTLYYTAQQNVTGLLATIFFRTESGTDVTTGEFVYLPPASVNVDDNGIDNFVYRVCDDTVDTTESHCALGVVYVNISKTVAAAVNTDNVIAGDEDLAQGPLELPVPALPNVFVLLDDSESMASDILTTQSEGYYMVGNQTKTYFLPEDGSGRTNYADTEANNPGKGLWRLRNSDFNKVYYSPGVTYFPWIGVDNRNNKFTDSDPGNAISIPFQSSSRKIDLEWPATISMPNRDSIFVAHHYTWTDIDDPTNCPDNVVGIVDGTSPHTDPGGTCTEGTLVEIKTAANGGSDSYLKGSNRTDCTTNTTSCSYTEEIQNYANFYSYARTRHYTSKSALGTVIADAENMRIGFGAFGGTSDNINIEEMNESALAGNKGALLQRLYRNNASSNSTPIRDSLERTGRYFECLGSRTIITSGATCPVLPAPEGNCQQNFSLVVTAGFWNANGPSNDIVNNDGDNGTDFDGGKFADSATQTLADVAMYFYERDLHPTLADEVPATVTDLLGAASTAFGGSENLPTMHQHMATFVIAFGVSGSISKSDVPEDYTEAFAWGDALTDDEKLNDLLHTSVNGRGDYLNASNPVQLKEALENAFEQFAQAIGTASAVSFNSQEIQEGSLVFRAFYNIRENTGDLVAQEFEDDGTLGEQVWSGAEQLDLKTFDTRKILSFDPTISNGAGGIPFRSTNLNSSQQLALEDDPLDVNAPGSTEFDAQILKHVNYLRGDSSNERPLGNLRERPEIKGRLGDIVSSTPVFYGPPNRSRRGSPPYPLTETYESFKSENANRRDMVYVSSNDGMVHGFDASDGEEIFAFIPGHIIDGDYSQRIKQLLSTNYSHRYAIDLSNSINDVYLDADRRSDTLSSNKDWATVLIGGYRGGAKGYFALDITDPESMTEANAADVVMWEFTDEDDLHPVLEGTLILDDQGFPISDLGYTYSPPTIAMSNTSDSSDDENRWVAVAGNGYNSTSGKAVLFVLFVDGGTDGEWCHPEKTGCSANEYDFVKLETPAVSDTIANGLGTPRGIDIDGNGTVDLVYAGDRFGNLYRFDLRDPDPSNWDSTLLFQASYVDPITLIDEAQPLITQPLVVIHPTVDTGVNCFAYNASETLVNNLCGGFIVLAATGSYIYEGDDVSETIQSMYGVWDRLGSTVVSKSDLQQQTYTAISGDANVGDARVLSENAVDYETQFGWYLDFAYASADGLTDPEYPGEKAIRNIQTRGGIVFVNSVIPKAELSCTVEAGGAANAFCAESGSLTCVTSEGIFDLNNDGIIDASDLTVDGIIVASTFFEDSVPTDSTFIGGDRVTQLSDQSLEIRATDTSGGITTGRISWSRLKKSNGG